MILELFFRKYAWTASAALVFAAAWFAARTVNTVAGAVIRPRPQVDLSALPAAPPRPTSPVQLEADRLYALVGLKPPPPPEKEEEQAAPTTPQNCADPSAAPAHSGLRGSLVAAVVSDRPAWSIATIADLQSRESRIFGVGDRFQEATIMSVERMVDDRDPTRAGFRVVVVLCNGGTKEWLGEEEGPASAAPPGAVSGPARAPGPAPAPAGPQQGLEGITRLSDSRYEIKRSVIDNTLSNLNSIATQARIVPSFKNGVANGFKLFSIQPGSLYSSIGVENGDVIQRINGYEINSPDKALEVYQKLRESAHITIEIERNGQVLRKEYNVAGP